MTPELYARAVRDASLMFPAVLTLLAVWALRPDPRKAGALLLSFLWNLPSLVMMNILAQKAGWWSFISGGVTYYNMPLELLLGWALLWGPLAGIAVLYWPVWVVALLAIVLDIVLMPLCAPVVQLNSTWLIGEAAAVAVCLLPSLVLVRLTVHQKLLPLRAVLQMGIYAGLFLFLVPSLAVGRWFTWPDWNLRTAALAELLFLSLVPGLSALQEFVVRGKGTPYPYDSPQRMVTTGPYAYFRNPMQLTTVLMFVAVGALLELPALYFAAVVAFSYSAGIAWWHENVEVEPRWGKPWLQYTSAVPNWIPRWQPYRQAPALLYVAMSCEICRQIRAWLEARGVTALEIRPAEEHPTRDLYRITYEDGEFSDDGIGAVSRALEHIHFCWAMLGFMMRLPVLRQALQLITDVVVAPPRRVQRAGR